MNETNISFSELFKLVFNYTKPVRKVFVVIILIQVFLIPLALLNPFPLKLVVDSVLGSHDVPNLLNYLLPSYIQDTKVNLLVFSIVLFIAINLLDKLFTHLADILKSYTGEKLVLNVQSILFSHAQRLSILYHELRGTNDTIYKIQHDAQAVEWLLLGMLPIIMGSMQVLGMSFIIANINKDLFLISISIIPLLIILSKYRLPKMRDRWSKWSDFRSSAFSVIQESLSSLRVVKAFGQESKHRDSFITKSLDSFNERIGIAKEEALYGVALGLAISIATAMVMYVGVKNVMSGEITLGVLLIVITYLSQMYGPIEGMTWSLVNLQRNIASIERAFSILKINTEVKEADNPITVGRSKGNIALHNVSYGYDSKKFVLEDINLDIPAGTKVGIIGKTGAGKSTFISLLFRFFDPTQGFIELDGININKYKLSNLRDQFSVVLQEPILFSSSVRDNISYSRPNSSMDDIIKAAKDANAHEFIINLPNGYDTIIGERGMTLSGGERQRLSIARAFLKNSPILILDEPTSSVDTKTEAEIIAAIDHLMQNRTTLMITHRIATIKKFDMLLQVGEKKIVKVNTINNIQQALIN